MNVHSLQNVSSGGHQASFQRAERERIWVSCHSPSGKPLYVPVGLHARRDGVEIEFSGPLASDLGANPKRYHVRTWSLKRSGNYGSSHYDERELAVASARLSSDRRSVFLELPEIKPTWCMAIEYGLKAEDGTPVVGEINNTIHRLGRASE